MMGPEWQPSQKDYSYAANVFVHVLETMLALASDHRVLPCFPLFPGEVEMTACMYVLAFLPHISSSFLRQFLKLKQQ